MVVGWRGGSAVGGTGSDVIATVNYHTNVCQQGLVGSSGRFT